MVIPTFSLSTSIPLCCSPHLPPLCSGHRGAAGADDGGDHRGSVRAGQRLLPARVRLLQQDHQRLRHTQVGASLEHCLIVTSVSSLLSTVCSTPYSNVTVIL